jgi:hypothetical protein
VAHCVVYFILFVLLLSFVPSVAFVSISRVCATHHFSFLCCAKQNTQHRKLKWWAAQTRLIETKATLGTKLRSKTNKIKYTTQKTKMMSSIDSTNRDNLFVLLLSFVPSVAFVSISRVCATHHFSFLCCVFYFVCFTS